jgi:hypothetical protein
MLGPEWKADPTARARAIARLRGLREALSAETGPPSRSLDQSLLIATWNVREFDSPTWGARLPESFAYMAEIIDRFDLVALQEVRDDLRALDRLLHRLGHHWSYLVSDVTEGHAGNRERLAYLYDTRKVRFLGMAGELVLPPVEKDGKTVPATQVARTPLMAAFQVGWTKFVLATVHIIDGDKTAEPVARVEEIRLVARFLRHRTDIKTEPIRNIITNPWRPGAKFFLTWSATPIRTRRARARTRPFALVRCLDIGSLRKLIMKVVGYGRCSTGGSVAERAIRR